MIVSNNHEEMSKLAAEKIITYLQRFPTALYCFAGGDTPVRTLELLVEAHDEKRIDLAKAYYVELDEWVGLDVKDQGSCASYLMQHLFLPANIDASHYHLFNAKSENLSDELGKVDRYIQEKGGITIGLKQLLASNAIVLVASGESKKAAIEKLLSGQILLDWPVTVLHNHPNTHIYIDEAVRK